MTYEEYRQYMKSFFERYYAKLSQEESELMLPLEECDSEMWSDGSDSQEEWKKWKMLPANVTDEEIAGLEEDLGAKLPLSLKAFLTVYYHYFEDPIGRNPISNPFEGILDAWNPLLVRNGYLPFTWDADGYFIRCIRLDHMPEEEKCGIYQIDHEVLFDFDENTVNKAEIDQNMKFISQNLLTYLDEILNDKDVDSLWEAAQAAVKNTLIEEGGIEDYDCLMDKLEESPQLIYEMLRPVKEQYALTDDDVESILDMLEYDF